MTRTWILAATALLLTGCITAETGNGGEDADGPVLSSNLDARVPPDVLIFQGTVSRGSGASGSESFDVTVPEGAEGLHATLTREGAGFVQLLLVDPDGNVADAGFPEVADSQAAATIAPPEAGTWQVRVATQEEDPQAFTVRAWIVHAVADARVEERLRLPAAGLLELNVIMEADARFTWAFQASEPVEWDVHGHDGPVVVNYQEGTGRAEDGTFTAPRRDVYSFHVISGATDPVDVTYAVDGAFRVHSRAIR